MQNVSEPDPRGFQPGANSQAKPKNHLFRKGNRPDNYLLPRASDLHE